MLEQQIKAIEALDPETLKKRLLEALNNPAIMLHTHAFLNLISGETIEPPQTSEEIRNAILQLILRDPSKGWKVNEIGIQIGLPPIFPGLNAILSELRGEDILYLGTDRRNYINLHGYNKYLKENE